MKKQWYIFGLCWLLVLVAQLFYVEADPVPGLSQSMGTYVDEGLNTCQARNYVNHGSWGFTECDNLVKSPLYNAYLAGVFKTFGTTRLVARLAILVPSFLLLFLVVLLLQKPLLGVAFLCFGALQLHVFQYQHIAMVESLANASILLLVYCLTQSLASPSGFKPKYVLLSCTLAFALFLLKVQYAYLLPLPFLVTIWAFFFEKQHRRYWMKAGGLGMLLYLLFALGFYGLWVNPNLAFIEMLMEQQVSGRFPSRAYIWDVFLENGRFLLWKDSLLYFQLAFVLTVLALPFVLKKAPKSYTSLLLVSTLWLLLEFHTVFIMWLPTRYALSLLFAQAWFISLVVYGMFTYLRLPFKAFAGVVFSSLLIVNVGDFSRFTRAATYSGKEIITYTDSVNFKDKKAIGVWSTALVWNKEAYLLPVWKGFLNDTREPLEAYQPKLLMGNQADFDSSGVFAKDRLQLHQIANDSALFDYPPFEIEVFVLK